MKPSPVAITGYGVISCAGLGSDALWKACEAGVSGIGPEGLGRIPEELIKELKLETPSIFSASRAGILAYGALQQAMKAAAWKGFDKDTGFIFATTTGQIDLWEKELPNLSPETHSLEQIKSVLEAQTLGSLARLLSDHFRITGPQMLISSACSAATQALGLASQWIQMGLVKRCVVGATEILSDLTVEGFRSLRLISPEPCKPFDEKRNGINLSEGGAFLCLERESDSTKGFISGFGLSSDAYHMTAPLPEGEGLAQSIRRALSASGLKSSDIQWVHAHGTGSPANDTAESSALQAVFSDSKIPVTSTKAIHGHTLAACGAIETIICLEALQKNIILKSHGCETIDPKIHSEINTRTRSVRLQHLLKNSSGFGGNNASLILTRGS